MLLYEITSNKKLQYDSWSFPSSEIMKEDFTEYQKKEHKKWKSRANEMGMRFPIFDNFEHFKNSLKSGKVIKITDDVAKKINHLTHTKSIDEIKNLVSGYVRPRDVDRIIKGFKNNEEIPYPIILKGKNGMFIMAGNTRINIARIFDIIPKALLIDVTKKDINNNETK